MQLAQPWVVIGATRRDSIPSMRRDARSAPTAPSRASWEYVREEHVLTLEDAVRKMTGHGVATRHSRPGSSVPERFAIVVLIRPHIDRRRTSSLTSRPGVDVVLVNGVTVVEEVRDEREARRAIRGPGYGMP